MNAEARVGERDLGQDLFPNNNTSRGGEEERRRNDRNKSIDEIHPSQKIISEEFRVSETTPGFFRKMLHGRKKNLFEVSSRSFQHFFRRKKNSDSENFRSFFPVDTENRNFGAIRKFVFFCVRCIFLKKNKFSLLKVFFKQVLTKAGNCSC